eukprot:2491310-Amphidinium_carterae.1
MVTGKRHAGGPAFSHPRVMTLAVLQAAVWAKLILRMAYHLPLMKAQMSSSSKMLVGQPKLLQILDDETRHT